MTFTTETDLVTLGYLPARQPDTQALPRLGGGRHLARRQLHARRRHGRHRRTVERRRTCSRPCSTRRAASTPTSSSAARPFNTGPMTYVLRASIDALNRGSSTAPRPRRRRASRRPATRRRRSRSTPTATRRAGSARPRSTPRWRPCRASGRRGRASAASSARRSRSTPRRWPRKYPTHAAFVKAWNAATDKAVKAGFVLAADAEDIKAAAAQSTVGAP